MTILTKNFKLLALIVGCVVAAGAGQVYWMGKKDKVMEELYSRKGFMLLDDKGAIFRTASIKHDERLLLIFTPDILQQKDVRPLWELGKKLNAIEKKNVEVALISRVDKDIVRNFARAARWPAQILFDPSGSVGRLTHAWPGIASVKNWGISIVDKDFRVYWTLTADEVIPAEELLKKL